MISYDDPTITLPGDSDNMNDLLTQNKFAGQGSSSSGSSQSNDEDDDDYMNDLSQISGVDPPEDASFRNIFDHQFRDEDYRCKLEGTKDVFKLVLDRETQQRDLLARWKKWVDADPNCRYVKKINCYDIYVTD